MRQHHFRHLPVTCDQAIVGILTDRDISLVLGPDFGSPDERQLRVRDAYLEKPCVVAASTPVAIVARTMAEHRVGAAIMTKHDKLVGIFTVTDACRALAEVLGGHRKDADSDSVA
jgi:CBS domain-containing protein